MRKIKRKKVIKPLAKGNIPAKVVLLLRDEGSGLRVVDYAANTNVDILIIDSDKEHRLAPHPLVRASKPVSEQDFMESVHDMLVGLPHGLDAEEVNQLLEIGSCQN